jgi:fatty-acyl-CoA synthase
MDWNFATVWEAIAALQPDRAAIIQGDDIVTWKAFNAGANALASALADRASGRQAKVGTYLRNAPAFLTTYFAAYKAGLVPFNINFRYGPDELAYLIDDADAEAIVFHAEFAASVDLVRARLPKVTTWIAVPQSGHAVPSWALPFDDITDRATADDFAAPWGRCGDDAMMLYTGGTTGMPKGVVWRQADAFRATGGGGNAVGGVAPMDDLAQGMARLAAAGARQVRLICPPLMHGAGLSPAQGTLSGGGSVILLQSRGFDAAEAWTAAARHRAEAVNIVGAAFAVPLAEALERNGDAWDLSCVKAIFSSGAMLDGQTRLTLLHYCTNAVVIDKLGASEISSLAEAITRPGQAPETAIFAPAKGFALIGETGEVLEIKPGARGQLASSYLVPVGYYKDARKTAETFREINGVRYAVPGDFAQIEADGHVRLLGRNSQCINTGGEKVFAEEVEEALKTHPAVRDAAVIGVPDRRFGATVFAVLELQPAASVTLADLLQHAATRLASYKLPRGMRVVPRVARLANGKIDYRQIKAMIEADAMSPGPDITTAGVT